MEEKEITEYQTREEKHKEVRKKSNKKRKKTSENDFPPIVKKIIIYFITAISLILVFYLGFRLSSSFETQTKTTKLGLKDVGELVTQTCFVTVLQDSKDNREFFKLFDIPFTESRQIFSYEYEVDASVNFEQIEYEPNDEKKEIVITIPHAKIYKTTPKEDSLKVYLDDESLFSNIDMLESNEAKLKMEKQATEDCKANGLLTKADENAIKLVEGMIKSNDSYKNYKVIIKYREVK